MTQITIAGTRTTGVGVRAGDSVTVTATGRLIVDEFAISSFNSPNALVTVYGLVSAMDRVAIDLSGAGADIVIGATGTVRNHPTGSGAAVGGHDAAIRMAGGAGCTVINNGRVIGETGIEVFSAGGQITNRGSVLARVDDVGFNDPVAVRLYGDGVVLRNSGSLNATNIGVDIAGAAGQVTLVNSGTITGQTGVMVSGDAVLTNSGTITSRNDTIAVQLGDGDTQLAQTGIIDGHVVGGSGANVVSNAGFILGDVRLATGNDVYFSTPAGRVTGFVSGGSGNDEMTGGAGVDRLSGAVGADTLRGGAGADFLDGGAGSDTLRGGAGNDRFVFPPFLAEVDQIMDFLPGDKIDLTATNYTSFAALFAAGTITQTAAGAAIDLAGVFRGKMILVGVTAASLDAGDFIF